MSIGYRLEFFRKYGFTYEESLLVMLTPPDKGILKLAGFPQDILDRVDEANNFCKEICEDLKEQSNLIEQKQEILNYLEIFARENKRIIDEWQGEDTRLIINGWEEIDQLFDINPVPQEQNGNTEPQEKEQCENTTKEEVSQLSDKEKFEKWLDDNKSMKFSPVNSKKVKYRRLSTYFEIIFNHKKPKDLIDKYINEYGFKGKEIKTILESITNDKKEAIRNLVNKYGQPI